MKAPFPYFGGKMRASELVWSRLGDTPNYVEPFAGSLAVLLARPYPVRTETVNDKHAYLANFWRAVQHDPDAVAQWCDWPVNEADLHARHRWLMARDKFRERMGADPDYYDAKIAGWWLWGICAWIAGGWCDGSLKNQRPHLGDNGRGIHSLAKRNGIGQLMHDLRDRLRNVRVCCGDWSRIMGPSPTTLIGTTAVFLDPPYSAGTNRDMNLYAEESGTVAHDVRAWCIENGDNPKLRIALCGYDGEHNELEAMGWDAVAWKANGGMGSQSGKHDNPNARRERAWFSPHCLRPMPTLFDMVESERR